MRPEITKAQIIGAVAAGVPVVMNLLAAFGVFTPTPTEQHALTEATKWATGFAVLLIASDAHLRGKRNDADAVKATAAATAASGNGNSHSDPGPAFDGRDLTAGKPHEHLGARVVYEPEPEPEPDRAEPDEVDLSDPALDDPSADSEAGVSRSKMAEHAAGAADAGDVAERDARIGASA